MSEQVYLVARVTKSFVNGSWVPITAVPRKKLRSAVREGRFGQKHLKDIGSALNTALHQTEDQLTELHGATKMSGTVRNIYNGKPMRRITESPPLGPHVQYRRTPKDLPSIRMPDKKAMRETVNPRTELGQAAGGIRAAGVRFDGDRAGVTAHEMAHGMKRRPGATLSAGMINRAASKKPELLSRVVANEKALERGTKVSRNPFGDALKLNQTVVRSQQKQMLGEEARADVVASRKMGRQFVSGHVVDTGSPKDYLKIRNRIEDGMKMPRTTRRDVMWGER